MGMGKKQQIMVDWFRKTLDESKKPWNTQVYLITDKYLVYIANKDIRLIGSNFGKAIDRPLKYFLFTDGKVQYYNSIEFLGYLPFELRDEYPVNCKPLNPWEYDYYRQHGITSEDLQNLFNND